MELMEDVSDTFTDLEFGAEDTGAEDGIRTRDPHLGKVA